MALLRKRNVNSSRTSKPLVDGKIKWLSKDMLSGSVRFSIVSNDDDETGYVLTLNKEDFAQLVALNEQKIPEGRF